MSNEEDADPRRPADNTTSPGLLLLDNSTSNARFNALISDYYVPMEIWFLRNAISKESPLVPSHFPLPKNVQTPH